MKKFFSFLMFICFVFCAFAKTGSVSGEKDLRVIQTKWFDIIYPERCYKSASILYQNVDTIYTEVTGQYGLEPKKHIPIVITPAVENLNAFWTAIPYSHIVLYDTSSDQLDSLAVFSENLLSIFRHELTHAVTNSMTNDYWTKYTNIIGDAINPGCITVTTGMSEGASLTSESANGEGRLNDEFAKHPVKQAKLEGKFPSYYEVQGTGDLDPYIFNGSFHEWLQKEYGMEKYTQFWYNAINLNGYTVASRFKKAYSEELKTAWQRFITEYQVPDIPSNPVKEKLVKDFFAQNKENYSRKNDRGSLYTSLTSSDKKIYWIDSKTQSVYSTNKESLNLKKTKIKKVLTQKGVLYKVSASFDDKYLAISHYKNNSVTIKAQVKIYNSKTGLFYTVDEYGLKDATIIQQDNDYYLVASKFLTPNNSIQIYKINITKNGSIKNVEKINEVILPLNVFTSEYTAIQDESFKNNFAFIKKDGLKYSICVADLNGNILYEYSSPNEKIVIHSLANQKAQLHFSWAKKDTLPRDGFITLNNSNADFYLSNKDLSGGIFEPLILDNKLFYIGQFLYQNRIFTYEPNLTEDYSKINGTITKKQPEQNLVQNQLQEESITQTNQTTEQEFLLPESVKFNSFNYYKEGVFIPAYVFLIDYLEKSQDILPIFCTIGSTYLTANPWTSGNNDYFVLSGAYNFWLNRTDFAIITSHGTDTSLFKFNSLVKTGFDLKNGWEGINLNFGIGSSFNFGRVSTLSIQNDTKTKLSNNSLDKTLDFSINDALSFTYSNVHFTGPGEYQKAGFTTSVGASCNFNKELTKKDSQNFSYELFGSLFAYVPQLLPFDSKLESLFGLPRKHFYRR